MLAVVGNWLRRVFDVAIATILLLILSPVLALVIFLIRLESPGAAIFRQTRMGREGELFTLYKLRTMAADAPRHLPHVYSHGAGEISAEEFFFHQPRDPRVTRIGRFLRKFSIDEVPNFVNVIRGEMALVGPRPEVPELAHLYGDSLPVILSVPPGVTSPAKAVERDRLSFEETLQRDLEYIDTRSVWLDVKTICLTAPNAIRGKNVLW